MRLLLDTVVLIHAVQTPERLSRRARAVLSNSVNTRELSSVSLAEIAIKDGLGKLQMSPADAREAIRDLDIKVLSYTGEHAFQLFGLALHHRDPFDRQIIAQALAEKMAIVTSDEKFSLYKGLKVIW